MSNQPKGGMQFSKKFADKGGSLFGGMKIKGPKQTKNAAQTQTNFSYNDKNSEDVANISVTRDDTSFKREYKETDRNMQIQSKGEDLNIKKTESKNIQAIQNNKKGQNNESKPKKIDASIKEDKQVPKQQRQKKQVPKEAKEPLKQIKEEVKARVLQIKSVQIIEKAAVVQQKKSFQRKKSQKLSVKRTDNQSTVRKPAPQIKQQKKPQQKPKKSDRQQVLDQINEYNLKLAQTVITQKNIQAKICQFRQEISELRQRTSHWASEQSLCAEREEYQEADKLQTRIEEAQNKIDELTIEMNLSEDQLLKQESQELNILKTQNGSIKKIGRKLKLIELQLQDDAAVIKREFIQTIQSLKSKQEGERKRIQRIEKDITYQNQQIGELQKIFKIELDSKLDPLLQEKTTLQTNKTELQSEMKELIKKIRDKKAQLGETNMQLKSVNENIAQINQSFRQQSTKLQQRKKKVQIIENQHQQMKSQMSYIQKQIEEQSKSMEEKIEKKLGEALQMASLGKSIQLKQGRFEDQIQCCRVAYDNYIQNGNILKEHEESHRLQRQKIKELSYKRANISAQISKLEQKRDSIRNKLPSVQAQQKKFAQQKNFKAAGLKKTEIKQMSDELVRIKERIQGCVIEQHSLTVKEQQLHNAQKNNIEEEEDLRKNLATSQYRYAQIKLQKIQEYKEQLSKHGQFKQRERVLKELAEVITKITEQINYLSGEYHLSQRKQAHQEEDMNIVQDDNGSDNDIQQQKEQKEEGNKMDNNQNNQQYTPPVFHVQLEQQTMEIDQQQESGYVPLSLD